MKTITASLAIGFALAGCALHERLPLPAADGGVDLGRDLAIVDGPPPVEDLAPPALPADLAAVDLSPPPTGVVALASGQKLLDRIDVVGATVYFSRLGDNVVADAGRSLNSVGINGGAVVTVVPMTGPGGLVHDQSNLYWTDFFGGGVYALPLGGGAPLQLATGSAPTGIAVVYQAVYWANYVMAGSIATAPVRMGATTTIATGQIYPNSLVADGATVYWFTTTDGAIRSAPLGGGPIATLASNLSAPATLAVDSTWLYWADANDHTIMKMPKGGGMPTILAMNQGGPLSIAVDGNFVYWGDSSDYTDPQGHLLPAGIKKMDINGGAVITLAHSMANDIALDATSIYWTCQECFQVLKTGK
jgi:hypothetical protein